MRVPLLATRIFLVVILAATSTATAQTADDLFEPGTLNDLRLFMNSRDLQQLRDTFDENTYYQADVEWRGIRVRSVAIRSRGHGSRSPAKPALRIDFSRYVAGQRFLGLESLTLDNLWQDPTLVRESVTMALFTKLGQPAPREAYARLFINDVYEGLYTFVEAIDSDFVSRAFGDGGGYVFEYQWQNPFAGEFLGRSLDPYKVRFKPESHVLEDDRSLYLPLHDLFLEVNRPESATWRASVERYLDVPGFLTHVAIETFVSELDGLLGFWAMNNFYVYRPTGSTRHYFLPWDRDNSFQAIESSIMQRADQNVMFRRLLEHPDLRAFYLQALETCADIVSQNGWLEHEIVARANLIRDAAYADTHKEYTNEEFEGGIGFLLTFARNRPGVVLAEVERLRREGR
jgi:spore coat protein CotH